MKPLLIALFCVSLLFLFAAYRVSCFFYYKKHQTKYHFYKMFPYEFNYPRVYNDNIFGNSLFILGLISLVAFYTFFFNSSYCYGTVTGVSMLIIIIIDAVLFLSLLLMPLNYLRTHAFTAIFSLTLSTVLPMLQVFYAFQSLQNHQFIDHPYYMDIIAIVVSGLFALFMLLNLLNPKASFKIYMDKALDSEGKEVFIRPRIIYMAFNEWASILMTFLSPLSLILLIILF